MNDFFVYDPLVIGSKGLVFIGNNLLVYRRDTNTDRFPLCIDLPGGGSEPYETPFDTFQREVNEEFGLCLNREDIVYARKYTSTLEQGKFAYFPVAKLPELYYDQIKFGDEGVEYMLMPFNEFILSSEIAWPITQERAKDYASTLSI